MMDAVMSVPRRGQIGEMIPPAAPTRDPGPAARRRQPGRRGESRPCAGPQRPPTTSPSVARVLV